MVIVVMQPAVIDGRALLLAGVGLRIRPVRSQRSVEPLDLPVGLRSVGPGAPVLAPLAERLAKRVGSVASPAVGHHDRDRHAHLREEGVGSSPEPGSGSLVLVVKDLGVDDPGLVVDGVMQKAKAARGCCAAARSLAVRGVSAAVGGRSTTVDVPAATVGDASLLLDVDRHQIP